MRDDQDSTVKTMLASAPAVDIRSAAIERALAASEDRFQTAFYSSPIAMAITTVAEGRYIDINEAFERQMGYTRSEICGRTSLELDVWPTPADRAEMIGTLQRQKTLRDRHMRFRTKSGGMITTLYSAGLITLDGRPCVLAAIADITAQKLAEDALRESEAKLRLLATTIQAGILIYRPDGSFCYFNPQVEAFTGYSADELRAMKVWDILHPDYRDAKRTATEARFRGEPAPFRSELQIVDKRGCVRWIDFTASRIEFDRQPAILGSAFDITDKKQIELQAKEHTALLQTLVANSPFGIMVGGKDHRIRLSNAAFQRMFLYSNDDVIGKDPDDLIGLPENTEATDISRRVLSGEIVHVATKRRRKDGSKLHVELHAIPLMSGNQFNGCFGIYQDITQRIEAEAQLRSLRGRLTRAQDEERAHIARELHDDIGQRLALLSVQLLQAQTAVQDEEPGAVILLETARQLVSDLCSDVHRLSHRLHPAQLALLGLTTALSRFCEDFARQNGIAIDFEHDDVPALSADVATCLYRVAVEAVRNAAKHSGASRVRVELARRPKAIWLCVSDGGRGFDGAAPDRGAAGLGFLSMTERVRSVGGDLSIRSGVEHGTRVETVIPLE